MLELFASETYRAVIDSVARIDHSGDDFVEVRGWAGDFLRKIAWGLEVPALEPAALRRATRQDISTVYGFSLDEKLGFTLRVPQSVSSIELRFISPGEERLLELDMRHLQQVFALSRARHCLGRAMSICSSPFTAAGRERLALGIRRRLHLDDLEYHRWIKNNETVRCADAEREIGSFKFTPLISIVTPVYNVEERWLRAFVQSVRDQWYDNWELCIADDKSPDARVRDVLEELASQDGRIKVLYREENGGISDATNSALELATGDFVGFMDNDDELAPQALFEVVKVLNEDSTIDFIYTDEDKIDEAGRRFDPFFKPGFSRQLLWSHNYITHFVVVSRHLLDQVGHLDAAYNGSQDYDFVLRATAKARRVHHIAQILYHWRTIETSVAGDPRSKLYAYEAGRKALEGSIRSCGIRAAKVEMLPNLGTYHVRYPIDASKKILIAVASGDGVDPEALRSTTGYANAEILVLDDVCDILQAARGLDCDFIVLLDGVHPQNPDWLDEMLGFMCRPDVGIVGGKVIDLQQRVCNVGVTLNALRSGILFEGAGEWDGDVGYYFRSALPRDIFAVTEDCMCIRTDDFESLQGWNSALDKGLRGIDMCMRLRDLTGKTALWQPFSTFLTLNEQYMKVPAAAIDSLLVLHGDVSDPFSGVWFPRKDNDHRRAIAYGVDSISRQGDIVTVVGWAANIHSHDDVVVNLSSREEGRILSIDRYPRVDVSRARMLSEDYESGFRIVFETSLDRVALRLSALEDEVLIPLDLTAPALFANRASRLVKKVAEIRHPRSFMQKVRRRFLAPVSQATHYKRYVESIEPGLWSSGDLRYRPLLSIVVPVYNVDSRWLELCVNSIKAQTYANWELCLADDHSSDPQVRPCLEALAASDKRIKVVFREENGHISRATNSALELAAGEFVVLMDNDDELSPHALYEVAAALNQNPELDLIYSDEDKIDEEGNRSDPTFKPDYSPDLLLSTNYISHLGVYRTSIVRAIGGFRTGYEGSQDYDLVLRFMEASSPERVCHIPKILYHWRMLPTSTAGDQGSKNYAFKAGLLALQSALDRREIDGEACQGPLNGIYDVHYRVGNPQMVSVIVPTKDGYDNIERCVTSILAKTAYPNYEILIADNGSSNPNMRRLYEALASESDHPIRVLDVDIPFNYSRINNIAARQAAGRYLLFLNDDTEVISDDWMTRMVGLAQFERVGAVGAKLYYPNNHVQHAGVVLGLGGVAGHVFAGAPRGDVGRYGRLMENANYYAVTAACCMVKADDFWAVDGFDETFDIAYNDVDLCIRLHDELGKDNVLAHEAELYHFESVTRGLDTEDEAKAKRLEDESRRFRERYGRIVERDPYYNENLSRTSAHLEVRVE